MTQATKNAIENLTPTEIYAGFEAVLIWMNAAENCIRVLDAFGEHEGAERIAATLEKLDTVITNAVNGVPASSPILESDNPAAMVDHEDVVSFAQYKTGRH